MILQSCYWVWDIMIVVDSSAAVELEEITQIIFDQQEGGGLCVVFKSWEYKGCIIGYPRKGYIVKGNVSRAVICMH